MFGYNASNAKLRWRSWFMANICFFGFKLAFFFKHHPSFLLCPAYTRKKIWVKSTKKGRNRIPSFSFYDQPPQKAVIHVLGYENEAVSYFSIPVFLSWGAGGWMWFTGFTRMWGWRVDNHKIRTKDFPRIHNDWCISCRKHVGPTAFVKCPFSSA